MDGCITHIGNQDEEVVGIVFSFLDSSGPEAQNDAHCAKNAERYNPCEQGVSFGTSEHDERVDRLGETELS